MSNKKNNRSDRCPNNSVLRIREIFISDPGSQIQKQQQKRGAEKNYCPTFIYDYHKIENYLIFELARKKFGPI
jgi:hypothetical protein